MVKGYLGGQRSVGKQRHDVDMCSEEYKCSVTKCRGLYSATKRTMLRHSAVLQQALTQHNSTVKGAARQTRARRTLGAESQQESTIRKLHTKALRLCIVESSSTITHSQAVLLPTGDDKVSSHAQMGPSRESSHR